MSPSWQAEFEADGCFVLPGVLTSDFIKSAKTDLERAIEQEVAYHGGQDFTDYGMVMLCSLYGGTFLELLENERFLAPFEEVLGPGCILYAYTSSSMPPRSTNYSQRMHVDSRRAIPNYVLQMGATILLDDFTEDNGATWYLPGSRRLIEPPPSEDFYGQARRLIAPAGSVWFFDARTWHAGGDNRTDLWRHALTVNVCRSWMKQRIDIPRAMAGMDLTGVSDRVLQKLGFHAQVPASYDEYYAPPERRPFRQAPD